DQTERSQIREPAAGQKPAPKRQREIGDDVRESHHPPIADLPRARAQNKRITLLVSVHELAHVVRIARAVAREENVGPHTWQGRRDEIDRALTSVAIAARRS